MRNSATPLLAGALCLLATFPCAAASAKPAVERNPFGTTREGQAAEIVTLRNSRGLTAQILTYGAAIHSLEAPDRKGHFDNLSANHQTLADYETKGEPSAR